MLPGLKKKTNPQKPSAPVEKAPMPETIEEAEEYEEAEAEDEEQETEEVEQSESQSEAEEKEPNETEQYLLNHEARIRDLESALFRLKNSL